MHSTIRGITLIELMIVVAIVAILASVGYPSYQDHVRKARRADAQTALLELAQFMERYYTTNGTYVFDDDDNLPFGEAPKEGATKYYNLDFSDDTVTATTYTLEAVPKGLMTGDPCGSLRITNTGAKSRTGTADESLCWRR
ncbi:type IV pilin protein [Aromatoleum anaerobium]|uniref:Prepilin-type N-terminal cleavage/methylation domain-containing protein n=1 Tax=Aromatoleum anaerobium TaxID=182180 RepID=A0ABX1PQD7_9RHOO|nr:type IV pilin protein [Aromatoleum anaerobium]